MKAIVFVLAALVAVASAGQNWAVLVAGSNTYSNYRHQADVLHAYHLLHDKGRFPVENIVLMMYDDIANSASNPVKGNIINKPSGSNLYTSDVLHDYVGKDVTAVNFLKILNGTAAGKKIESGPDDNIFVYYSDHGAPGLVAMPSGGYLYATDLLATIKQMFADKKYKKMVLYIEACESGSMCQNLDASINVFCTTAANPTESSYAYYYDSTRKTYLGDEYSVMWMEDSDLADFDTYTLAQQFTTVQGKTKGSHVMEYGDMSMSSETIGVYQAYTKSVSKKAAASAPVESNDPLARVSSRDVELAILMHQQRDARAQFANSDEQAKLDAAVATEIEKRKNADALFQIITQKIAGQRADALALLKHSPRDFECLKSAVEGVEASCGKLSDYAMGKVQLLVNLCEEGFSGKAVASLASDVCAAHPALKF